MHRRTVAALAAVALVALAGCLGGTDAEHPPGVTDEGVEDPAALIAAHEAALDETAYRVNATLTGEARGLPDRLILQMRFGDDGDYYGRRILEGGGRARVGEIWRGAGGDRWYNATVATGPDGLRRDVQAHPIATFPGTGFTFVNFTRRALRRTTAATDGAAGTVTFDDGDWMIVLQSSDGGSPLRLSVAPSGLIRRVVSERPDRTWTVTTERIDGVEEPVWVQEHRRSAGG